MSLVHQPFRDAPLDSRKVDLQRYRDPETFHATSQWTERYLRVDENVVGNSNVLLSSHNSESLDETHCVAHHK